MSVKGNLSINPKLTLEGVTVFVEGNLNLNGGMNLGKTVILAQQIEVNGSEGKLEDSVLIAAKGLNLNTALDSSNQSTVFAAENISVNGKIKANEQLALIAKGNIKLNSGTQAETKVILWAGGTVDLNGSSSLEGGILAGGAIRSNGVLSLTKALKIYNPDVPGYRSKINTTPATVTGILRAGGSVVGPDGVSVVAPKDWPVKPTSMSVERIDPSTLPLKFGLYDDITSNFYKVSTQEDISSRVPFQIEVKLPQHFPNTIGIFGLEQVFERGGVDFGGKYYWSPVGVFKVDNNVLKIKRYTFLRSNPFIFIVVGVNDPKKSKIPTIRSQAIEDNIGVYCPLVQLQDSRGNLVPSPSIIPPCSEASIASVKGWARNSLSKIKQFMSIDDSQILFDGEIILMPKFVPEGNVFSSCQPTVGQNTSTLGWYVTPGRQEEQTLFLCTEGPDGHLPPDLANGISGTELTVRHELLHAVQFGMAPGFVGSVSNKWILEGTARAVEGSLDLIDEMNVSPNPRPFFPARGPPLCQCPRSSL
jgi:hypothetical protein